MLKAWRLYYTSRLDLLVSLGKCNQLITWNTFYETTFIPQYFLYSISKKYCTNFKPLFMAESTYFHRVPYIYSYNT